MIILVVQSQQRVTHGQKGFGQKLLSQTPLMCLMFFQKKLSQTLSDLISLKTKGIHNAQTMCY